MGDWWYAVHGVYGGVLFALCWLILKPLAIFSGILGALLEGLANLLQRALDHLERVLL
jgi:hypothetical protein